MNELLKEVAKLNELFNKRQEVVHQRRRKTSKKSTKKTTYKPDFDKANTHSFVENYDKTFLAHPSLITR